MPAPYWSFLELIPIARKICVSSVQVNGNLMLTTRLKIIQLIIQSKKCTHVGRCQLFPKSYLQLGGNFEGIWRHEYTPLKSNFFVFSAFFFLLVSSCTKDKATTRVQWIFSWILLELYFLINMDYHSFRLKTLPFVRFFFLHLLRDPCLLIRFWC